MFALLVLLGSTAGLPTHAQDLSSPTDIENSDPLTHAPSQLPRSVEADPVPDLSLPQPRISTVDTAVGPTGLVSSSNGDLVIYTQSLALKLSRQRPYDELLSSELQTIGSRISWGVEANTTGTWLPLIPTTSEFAVLGTNSTGTYVSKTTRLLSGPLSANLTVVYKASSTGTLKWDLGFTAPVSSRYKLTYVWSNMTDRTELSPSTRRIAVDYGLGRFTYSWDDVPASFPVSTDVSSNTFTMSIDLGLLASGSSVQIDPSLVAVVGGADVGRATAHTFQRRVFYEPEGGYYWAFYRDSYITWKYSLDGREWKWEWPSENRLEEPGMNCSDFGLFQNGQTIIIACGGKAQAFNGDSTTLSVPLKYKRGTISEKWIYWEPATTVLTETGTCPGAYAECTLGIRYVSVIGSQTDVALVYNRFFGHASFAFGLCQEGYRSSSESVLKISSSAGVFEVASTKPYAPPLGDGADCYRFDLNDEMRSILLPNGRLIFQLPYHTYGGGYPVRVATAGVELRGDCDADAVVQEGIFNSSPGKGLGTSDFSAVVDNENGVHVVYRMPDETISYAYCAADDSEWNTSSNIFQDRVSQPTMTVDYATNDVYVAAFRESSSSVMMKMKRLSESWADRQAFSAVVRPAGTAISHLNSNYMSAGNSESSWISLIWTEGSSVDYAALPIQTVWSPFASPSDPWDGYGIVPYGQYFANLDEHVSTSTGLLTIRQTDLTIPGRGLDLTIARVYSEPYAFLNGNPYSYETYPYASLGNGWALDLPWMSRLARPAIIHLWGGQGYRIPSSFWDGSSGSFENHRGEHFRLVRNGDTVALFTKTGVYYDFDSSHRLTRITHPTGTSWITLEYDGNSRIWKITDTIQRVTLFCHDPVTGILSSLVQTTGDCTTGVLRRVRYDYSGSKLTSVTDPAERVTRFAYAVGVSGNDNNWLISKVTYPTRWFTSYSYYQVFLGTEARSYRINQQTVSPDAAPMVKRIEYTYIDGPGSQVIGSAVKVYEATAIQPVSITEYSFSFAGMTQNLYDGSHRLVRGVQQTFGGQGAPVKEVAVVVDGVGSSGSYTNHYQYDLWGNQIYSRRAIAAGLDHESFAAYYNNRLPLGFSAFAETFSQEDQTLPDNQWSAEIPASWSVIDGVYNGSSHSARADIGRSDITLQASVLLVKPMVSSDPGAGIFAHSTSGNERKWILALHDAPTGGRLELVEADGMTSRGSAACQIVLNVWYTFSMTVSGFNVIGSVNAPSQGISCTVQGTYPSWGIWDDGTGFGLYAGSYMTLFDNVLVKTIGPDLTGDDFSSSFYIDGAPSSSVHGALAGAGRLQNGTGSLPIESYYSYYSWGGLSQTKQRYDSPLSGIQWLVTTATYDGLYGNLKTYTDPTGKTAYFDYSGYGGAYLTNETIVLTGETSTPITRLYGYDPDKGYLLSSQDPMVNTITYEYDILGRPMRVNYPGFVDYIQYNYNDQLNYVDVTNEMGWWTRQHYDGLGRLSKVEKFLQGASYSTETYSYNWMNRPVSSTDPVGRVATYQYDVLGRTTLVTKPDGNVTQLVYDDYNSRVRSTNEDGVLRCNIYDRLGRLISVVEQASIECALGFVSNYYYDEVGNLVKVSNANGQSTTHNYDSLNRLTRTVYPDQTTELYMYDSNGNVVRKDDRKSVRTLFAYDSLDRLVTISHCGSPVTSESYTYDKNNNLRQLESQNATLTYTYDLRDRILEETYMVSGGTTTVDLGCASGGGGGNCDIACPERPAPEPLSPSSSSASAGGTPLTYTVDYSYFGEVLNRIAYPDGLAVIYDYDSLGRVQRVFKSGTSLNYATFSYYRDDRIDIITFGNAAVENYDYNRLGQPGVVTLKKSSGTGLLSLDHDYTKTGAVASITGWSTNSNGNQVQIDEQYGYDSLQRLTSAVVRTGSTTTALVYEYDNVGNRNRETLNSQVTSYVYDPKVNLLTSSSRTGLSNVYSYDPNGNLKTRDVTTTGTVSWAYDWDTSDRLTQVKKGSSSQGSYAYDGMGRRVESFEANVATFYAYLGTETLYEKVSEASTGTNYVYAAGLRIAKVSGNTVNYYSTDHLGSTRLVTDSPNNTDKVRVVFSDSYQPFGADNGPTGSESYKFTGKPYSSSTGLYYSFQRWYDPEVGRFISQDIIPGDIGQPQTLNRYSYVANSPTNYVDPTGLAVETPFDIASAAYDVTECIHNPNLVNCGIAAIDVALIFVPGIPAVAGPIYRGGSFLARHGDDAVDVARTISRFDWAVLHLDDTAKVFPRLDDAMDTSIFWRNVERGGAWTGNFEKHHLLPKEFADFFKVAGFKINSGQYLIKLEHNVHKVIHGKGGFLEEGWNAKWQDFVELNRGIRDPAILHQRVLNYLSQLKTEFYLP